MTKDEIHESWWNGDRDKLSCCEGVGVGYEYQKHIADLEKHNEELVALINAERERQEKCDDVHLRTIAKLEKENAELEARVQTLEQIKKEHTDYTIKVEEERTSVKEQLTKAKDLLQKVINVCGYPNYDIPTVLYYDIADFLKI